MTLKCCRFRDAFCTCVFAIFIRLQFCIISFISNFIFIRFAKRKCVFFRWFWCYSLVLLIFTFSTSDLECLYDVTIAFAGLQLLVVFSSSLSLFLARNRPRHKKTNTRVSSQICQMDCKMSTKIRWNKKIDVNAVMYTHHTLSTLQWCLRMTVKSGTRHTPQFNTLNVWYKERYTHQHQLSE